MPIISVIIPYYNDAKWIRQAIKSVLEQSYKNWELIIIDDASGSKLINTSGNSHRIKIIRNRYNLGPGAARNIGINLARGKYLAFLDADDKFCPQKLQKQFNLMKKNPKILMSHTSYNRIDTLGKIIQTINSGKFSGKVYPNILFKCPIATPTVMLNRQLLGSLRFPEDIKIGEDVVFWIKIARLYPIIGISEALSDVRIMKSTVSVNNENQIQGIENIYSHVKNKVIRDNPITYLKLKMYKDRNLTKLRKL